MIEIRRYTTAEGRDVFGEWLTNLADLKARAADIKKARAYWKDYKERTEME